MRHLWVLAALVGCSPSMIPFNPPDDTDDAPDTDGGADTDPGGTDTDPGGGLDTGGGTGSGTCTDAYEPNDTPASATPLAAGATLAARICVDDLDYYEVTLQPGCFYEADLTFRQSDGDLDLYLVDDAEILLASETETDDEYLEYYLTGDEDPLSVYLVVVGYLDATAPYTVRNLTTSCVSCTDDAAEPDNTPADATALSPGVPRAGQICVGGQDWYRLAVPGACTLDASLTFSQSQGDLDLYVIDQSGASVLASATSETSNEALTYAYGGGAGHLYLLVHGYDASSAPYTLQATCAGASVEVEVELAIEGELYYDPSDGSWLGWNSELWYRTSDNVLVCDYTWDSIAAWHYDDLYGGDANGCTACANVFENLSYVGGVYYEIAPGTCAALGYPAVDNQQYTEWIGNVASIGGYEDVFAYRSSTGWMYYPDSIAGWLEDPSLGWYFTWFAWTAYLDTYTPP